MEIVLLIVVVAVVVVAALWLFARKQRTDRLQNRFGPEYERAVDEAGGQRQAETELVDRERRRDRLDIRPLADESQRRYGERWRAVQADFVDRPGEAVGDADRLVAEVMRERGYPMEDFEQRAADVSVDHPLVVENYRAAHMIVERHDRGDAGTEDLRQAMVHYRSLFDELLGRSASDDRTEVHR